MKNGPPDGLQEATRWVVDTWCTYFREVLEAMTFEQAKVAAIDTQPSKADGEETIWWKQTLSYPDSAAVWVGASSTVSAFLATKVLAAAGVEENEPELLRRTYQELVQQTTPAVARVLGSKFEREVTCNEGQEDSDGPEGAQYWIEVRVANEKPVRLVLAVHPVLAEHISNIDQFAEEEKSAGRPQRIGGDGGPAALLAAAVPETGPAKTIDLILDVELPVSVSFGRAYMPLKEVLRLTSGSIVELNRPVADPVEVIVNNCVIARGEVVVIDGNYGVRINQIISRRDRLRTLT